jgi:hypothetical protein
MLGFVGHRVVILIIGARPRVHGTPRGGVSIDVLDQVVMLIVAIAIASVVIVAFLIWLYIWALKVQREREDEPFEEDRYDVP